MTKMAPAQGAKEGKEAPTRGMAPLGCRIVEHGIYVMPFFINPTAAIKSGCTKRDVDLLRKLIPYAYPHTASTARPWVDVRHAWYVEHKSPLGSCSDFDIIDALMPKRKGDREQPSSSEIPLKEQYEIPEKFPEALQSKLSALRDLCNERQ
jgi:CRISPR/Cas system type I-B associated protein Csh2 (Cas7 group RAMP superfamily)